MAGGIFQYVNLAKIWQALAITGKEFFDSPIFEEKGRS